MLRSSKVSHDDDRIDERDLSAKLKGKRSEDRKRAARECRAQAGDTVIIARQSRTKGESRFLPTRYTVVNESNGNLDLVNDEGQQLKRHVSQTKIVQEWRVKPTIGSKGWVNRPPLESIQNKSTEIVDGTTSKNQERPVRNRKVPKHLQDFVYLVDENH